MADPKIVVPHLRRWLDAKLKRPSDLENNEVVTRQGLSRILRAAERENVSDEFKGVYLGTVHKIAAFLGVPSEALQYTPDDPRVATLLEQAEKPTIEQWLQQPDAMIKRGVPATAEFKRALQSLLDLSDMKG